MLGSSLKVFLAPGATDLRKSINGLSVLAASGLELDVLSGSLFVFCNRKRDLIKIVYWDRNGFCLCMKRRGNFRARPPVLCLFDRGIQLPKDREGDV